MKNEVLILAGGRGRRLDPYTTILPKPLMPIGDRPILEILLEQLKRHGISRILIALGHLGQLFEAFFADGKKYGLEISYLTEDQPLGTAGPIANALDLLEDDFLVMNGDLLTTFSYRNLISDHKKSGAAATIGVYNREVKIDFGVLDIDPSGLLQAYHEKPVYKMTVSMGINMLNRAAITPHLEKGQYLDLPDLLKRLMSAGKPVRCYQEVCDWLDIGRLDDYQAAAGVFEAQRDKYLPAVVSEPAG